MGENNTEPLVNKSNSKFTRCVSNIQDELQSFRRYLKWMCVDQSNGWTAFLSWSMFIIFGILVPATSHFFLACSTCDGKHKRPYDAVVQLSLSSVAALSFVCLTGFVKKFGLRRFLFFDKLWDESEIVRHGYTAQLNRCIRLLLGFVLPCFLAESAYKVWWYASGASGIPFLGNVYLSDAVACAMDLLSWLYRTIVIFLVCVLFRLICHLQILRLEDFAKVFQTDSDVKSILTEHFRIRRHLRIISHRYRAFILWALMLITGSQFASLLSTTKSHDVNIYRAGELALCSMTLVAALLIILRSATKITHKAQAITCLAAKWHVCATLNAFDNPESESPKRHDVVVPNGHAFTVAMDGGTSEGSDAEDEGVDDDDIMDDHKLLPSYAHNTISFQRRQALVMYFENNSAGITVFGFTLDRSTLHTIFGIELSLVLWLLGKTIGI